MIVITVDAAAGTLTCDGHAGFAAAGEDIVCAAVSGILYTLRANLPGRCVEAWAPGHIALRTESRAEWDAVCFCLRGLALVEDAYRENVALQMRPASLGSHLRGLHPAARIISTPKAWKFYTCRA